MLLEEFKEEFTIKLNKSDERIKQLQFDKVVLQITIFEVKKENGPIRD